MNSSLSFSYAQSADFGVCFPEDPSLSDYIPISFSNPGCRDNIPGLTQWPSRLLWGVLHTAAMSHTPVPGWVSSYSYFTLTLRCSGFPRTAVFSQGLPCPPLFLPLSVCEAGAKHCHRASGSWSGRHTPRQGWAAGGLSQPCLLLLLLLSGLFPLMQPPSLPLPCTACTPVPLLTTAAAECTSWLLAGTGVWSSPGEVQSHGDSHGVGRGAGWRCEM